MNILLIILALYFFIKPDIAQRAVEQPIMYEKMMHAPAGTPQQDVCLSAIAPLFEFA
jgi:hypothetical protein